MSSLNEATLIQAGLQAGLFDNAALARLRPVARARRQNLLTTLATDLALPQAAFYLALSELRGLPYARLSEWPVDEHLLARLPATLLKRHPMAAVRSPDGLPHLAVANPDDALGVETARRVVGALPLAVAEPEALTSLLYRLRGPEAVVAGEVEDPVQIFERIAQEALLRRASDIHIESIEVGAQVRLRVDGRLEIIGAPLAKHLGDALISRIKVLSGMDIAEVRAPQDGGLIYTPGGNAENAAIEMRVASAPVKFGERVTLRVMKSDPNRQKLDSLGLPPSMAARFREALGHPHGIVLVTGPTGSGKSTTLYCALRELDAEHLNILTAEDPIEQVIPGVSQVQVGSKVDFAGALRSFLRHDPDVILVGEIRDLDTADVALKAATTGHMVLSTLHTNSAPGAVTRLSDIGCERFMLGATLRGILAQRLVRMLCPRCRRQREASATEKRLLRVEETDAPLTLWDPVGCPHCLGSGYRGRIGLYEALWVDAPLAAAISAGADEREIAAAATDYWRLADDAREKTLAGLASLADVRFFLEGEQESGIRHQASGKVAP
ncbi:MAG: type II/IV secretion system protein [Zoogloeaceae bacterium]|jgi:type IV pilus assembly protein PilB|nr:type II/IV secretion system protein [Zoogloeaceae bacterium]